MLAPSTFDLLPVNMACRCLVRSFSFGDIHRSCFNPNFIPYITNHCRSIHRKANKMTVLKTYQGAIEALNSLQSNAQTIEKARKERNKNAAKNITWMVNLLRILNVEPSDLDKLNVIHVSGTKGKGSTCAFMENLLRNLGYRTGFYSSPHLVAVRERIRLNGKPISEELFTEYFWEVYGKLVTTCEPEEMPPYFKFLTVMCYYVFLKEKIDVAVMEVGIGGAYDCTNVIRHPIVCGVTSLGYDHMPILGNTLAEIAWHKAGIFKPGCPAVTVHQPTEAMDVLQKRAVELDSPLFLAPELSQYSLPNGPLQLGIEGPVQSINASLALQLVRIWLSRTKLRVPTRRKSLLNMQHDNVKTTTSSPEKSVDNDHLTDIDDLLAADLSGKENLMTKFPATIPGYALSTTMIEALETCVWPGRFQSIIEGGIQYFLDGAHTNDSIQYCADWYRTVQNPNPSTRRILLFNSTADRKPQDLLTPLVKCGFDMALFCPNILGLQQNAGSDLANFTVNLDQQLARCEIHQNLWDSLVSDDSSESECFDSVYEALSWIRQQCNGSEDGKPVEVLITGSLHLVGAVLTVLDPSLKKTLL